jgi:hypothetical protein
MKPEGSLLYSKVPAIDPYPEPDESNPYTLSFFSNSHAPSLGLPSGIFLLALTSKPYIYVPSSCKQQVTHTTLVPLLIYINIVVQLLRYFTFTTFIKPCNSTFNYCPSNCGLMNKEQFANNNWINITNYLHDTGSPWTFDIYFVGQEILCFVICRKLIMMLTRVHHWNHLSSIHTFILYLRFILIVFLHLLLGATPFRS